MPDITYRQLQKQVADLAKTVARDGDAIRAFGKQLQDEATDTARIGDAIGSIGVDSATVGETNQLAMIMRGLVQAATNYTAAADTTSKAANAAHTQARTSHQGIQEAFTRSPVDLSNLKRDWLTQE